MREMKDVKEVDLGLVMQIFNEIDADGNQTIDQREMFNFIKNQEFRDSNLPEQSLKRQNSLVQMNKGKTHRKPDGKEVPSILAIAKDSLKEI